MRVRAVATRRYDSLSLMYVAKALPIPLDPPVTREVISNREIWHLDYVKRKVFDSLNHTAVAGSEYAPGILDGPVCCLGCCKVRLILLHR